MADKHFCVGGPLNNKMAYFQETLIQGGYEAYNCSSKYPRTKITKNRARKAGKIIPPSCIFVHKSVFLDSPHFD